MIEVNGRKFAKNDAEFVGSLFDPTGTCQGYYSIKKGGKVVVLSDHQRKPRVAAVMTQDGPMLVTCHKRENGRLWYMFSTTSVDEQWLGVEGYRHRHETAQAILNHR